MIQTFVVLYSLLSYTGGIPLYQEQLMKMAVKVGFSLDESEQLRRIIGKGIFTKTLSIKKYNLFKII